MRQWILAAILSLVTVTALSIASGTAGSESLRINMDDPRSPYEGIAGAALLRGGAYSFLETLTDTIGPRLTGSEQSQAAADLLLRTLTAAGLDDVHVETYPLRSRWRRGTASARVVGPVAQPLVIQSFGWAPSTRGTIEGDLADAGSLVSTTSVPSVARGALVMADFPGDRTEPGYATRGRTARILAAAGASALIIPSDKPNRLLDIGCFGNYPGGALPMVSVAREDAFLLRRLLAQGVVRLSMQVENTLETSAAVERNVVGSIRGTSMADRVILVGAHFDSWDTATGANDDGSGVAAVVETARILQSLSIRTKRTIRFVFFSGEEQAILGSHAYVEAHEAELDRVDAVLIMDEGAGTPRGVRLHGRLDLEGSVRRILEPLRSLGAGGVSQEPSFDQDHAYFLAAGVPALTLWVDPGEYETHHHAVTDTIDKIDRRALAIDTAVMATATMALANADTIGRRLSPVDRAALLERTGLARSVAALAEPLTAASRH